MKLNGVSRQLQKVLLLVINSHIQKSIPYFVAHCPTKNTQKIYLKNRKKIMVKLTCAHYGYECDFVVENTDIDEAIESFGNHTLDEHGIEYSKEALMQFILRQGS